jgi:hypothetical protein
MVPRVNAVYAMMHYAVKNGLLRIRRGTTHETADACGYQVLLGQTCVRYWWCVVAAWIPTFVAKTGCARLYLQVHILYGQCYVR